MAVLTSELIETPALSPETRDRMYDLMLTCYLGMDRSRFDQDLAGKDEVILLYDEDHILQGFSTQVSVTLDVEGRQVSGIFSGDTVISPEAWGSGELFRRFAQTYCTRAKTHFDTTGETLYWFLISKGHRTYRILPTFYKEFYPSRKTDTPADLQQIMDSFAEALFGDDYDRTSGVIRYKDSKDSLRPGIADPDEGRSKQPDVRFFLERNPDWSLGHDLVCITSLHPDNLRFPERLLK